MLIKLKEAASQKSPDVLPIADLTVKPKSKSETILLGLVCYDPSVPSIWKGMIRHFSRCGLDVDFVTFTSYERLVEALLDRKYIDVAWNGPLAHARCIRLTNGNVISLGMRDVDRDFTTHIVTRTSLKIKSTLGLNDHNVACGTVDSPQAYILPWFALEEDGVELSSLRVTRFDRDIGKHGDTALGEDGVLAALRSEKADAGFISDLMWQRYLGAGKADGLSVLKSIKFDHCQFTGRLEDKSRLKPFQEALSLMTNKGDLAHEENARTMQLEGIKKEWMPPRGPTPESGYEKILKCLDKWNEPRVTWPGLLHTPARHPFKSLEIDYRLVRDNNGC